LRARWLLRRYTAARDRWVGLQADSGMTLAKIAKAAKKNQRFNFQFS
jgi:hypothetical protein